MRPLSQRLQPRVIRGFQRFMHRMELQPAADPAPERIAVRFSSDEEILHACLRKIGRIAADRINLHRIDGETLSNIGYGRVTLKPIFVYVGLIIEDSHPVVKLIE